MGGRACRVWPAGGSFAPPEASLPRLRRLSPRGPGSGEGGGSEEGRRRGLETDRGEPHSGFLRKLAQPSWSCFRLGKSWRTRAFSGKGPRHRLPLAPGSRGAVSLRPQPRSPLAPGSLPRAGVRGRTGVAGQAAGGPWSARRRRGEGGDCPRPRPRADGTALLGLQSPGRLSQEQRFVYRCLV